jgi:hypothetical protein
MATKSQYKITIKWKHRKLGPQSFTTRGEGLSARRAVNKSLRNFFSSKSRSDREHRKDAHKEGEATWWRIPK